MLYVSFSRSTVLVLSLHFYLCVNISLLVYRRGGCLVQAWPRSVKGGLYSQLVLQIGTKCTQPSACPRPK
jgi:hypothetical protein